MLTGPEIQRQVELGALKIDPFDPGRCNPNSYNLRLGPKLLIYARRPSPYSTGQIILDMAQDNPTVEIEIPDNGLILAPRTLYLGATMETTDCGPFIPILEGRSSVARLGLVVHQTAGFGETFFKGSWTLELTVVHPLRIYSGVEICQIAFLPPTGAIQAYQGKYQGQNGPVASRMWKEFVRPPDESARTHHDRLK